MAQFHPAWIAHQRKRWMRANAHLWIRPDAYRFMPPGSPRYVGKDAVRYFWPEHPSVQHSPVGERKASVEIATELDIAAEREELLRLQRELAAIKFELKLRRLLREKAYNPNQPRDDHGRWTNEGGGSVAENQQADRTRVAQIGGTVTDAYGQPYYNPGGHHEVPKDVYEKWKLRPETLRVFRQGTTGTVPDVSIRSSPDGVPTRHYWGGEENLHKSYNRAVRELANGFLEKNGITPEQMTPDHARALLKEIRESEDPRIRDYNRNIRTIRRLFRLRPGTE
jgi:hypothetical protein